MQDLRAGVRCASARLSRVHVVSDTSRKKVLIFGTRKHVAANDDLRCWSHSSAKSLEWRWSRTGSGPPTGLKPAR